MIGRVTALKCFFPISRHASASFVLQKLLNSFILSRFQHSLSSSHQNIQTIKSEIFPIGHTLSLSTTTITGENMSTAVYEEIKDLPNHPEKTLIDVREPDELKQTGVIPTSINIPRS